MKHIFMLLTALFILNSCGGHNNTTSVRVSENEEKTPTTYKLIQKTYYPQSAENDSTQIPGIIDSLEVLKLNEPLKAMAAFYAAMGGSMCTGEYCDLTTALGLGEQGSNQHKSLINKYLPDDEVAATVIKQDCYLRPSGASTFSDYEYLTIIDLGDTIEVDYNLMYYNRGEIVWITGPDLYLFAGNKFKKIKRNLWSHIDNKNDLLKELKKH